jgi:multidrug efflux system membrane fusion protein
VPIYLDGLGTVIAKNTATVRSRVDGELQKLHFAEGDVVKAGQLLAELDPRPFEVALAQAQGQLAGDEANLTNARADLARYKTLLAQDSVASQKVDTQEALVRQLEGTVKAEQASVASARLQLDYSRITAPISGRLGLKQVDIGNQVQSASATGIVVITQVQPINMVFSIPEAQLPSVLDPLRSGKPLAVDAWDRDLKKVLAHGKLLTVDNQIDTTTGTVKLKAEFDNQDNSLFPNQFVNARIQVGVLHDAVEAPVAAVQLGKVGNFVWVMDADKKVTMHPVKAGPRNGELIVLTEGVKAGEMLITDGVDHLSDGAQVKVVDQAQANAPAAGGDAKGGKHKRGGGDKAAS